MPSDHMDEDSPKWPWVPQSHIDWSSQYGSESSTLEVAGCEWRYALLVVQARNDDDEDQYNAEEESIITLKVAAKTRKNRLQYDL